MYKSRLTLPRSRKRRMSREQVLALPPTLNIQRSPEPPHGEDEGERFLARIDRLMQRGVSRLPKE